MVNIFSFTGQAISVTTTQFCHYNPRTTDKKQTSGRGCVLIKLIDKSRQCGTRGPWLADSWSRRCSEFDTRAEAGFICYVLGLWALDSLSAYLYYP